MAATSVVALLLVATACHRPTKYEATVEITRMAVVRKDAAGKVNTLDFELSYVDCPGSQSEVIRGDAAFAACTAKYAVGQRVKIDITHVWSSEGHWEWQVRRVGDCAREPDPDDEASYALVRDCADWNVNGTRVGFECKYTPEKKLLEKCPWFRRQ